MACRAIRPGAGSSRRCSPIARSRCARAARCRRSPSRTRRGGRSNADASNAVLLLHALTLDSHAAGPVEPGHAQLGWWNPLIGPGPRDRHRPVLRRVPERARRVPGHDGAGVDRSRRRARRTGRASRSRRSATRSTSRPRSPTTSASRSWYSVIGGSMGGQRALEWAVKYRDRVPRAVVIACGAAATAEQIALCSLQIRAIEADPHFHGGDYYDARRRTVARPVDRARHRAGVVPLRARARSNASTAATRTTSIRSRAACTRSSRTSSTTARSSRTASTRTPTSCCHAR